MTDSSHRFATVTIGAIAALSGIVALFAYVENRRDKGIKSDLLRMEHELKELEIAKAQAEVVQIYS